MQKVQMRLIDAVDRLGRPTLVQPLPPAPRLIQHKVEEAARSNAKLLALSLMAASTVFMLLLIGGAWMLAQRVL